MLLKHKKLFDNLFPNPLTQEQRLSIVDDSYRTLVIASAGSGKTTTLVGKYAFLLAEELAAPKEILVLAFNKAIEQELSEKIKKLIPGGGNPEVYTFHGFGLELLNKVEGRKKVDLLAESSSDGLLDTTNVLGIIERAKSRYPKIEEWVSEFRAECPFHQIEEFARDEREYNEAVTSYPYKRELFRASGEFRPQRIPSLDTRYWVRSQQELTIINSLVMKGVKVEYERPHPDGGITPDFYYPEIDLWHEHFALNRNGNSPFPGYVETFQKKKKFYQKQGKDFLFTYSYEYYEGTVLEKIYRKLDEKGISYDPPQREYIDRQLGELYTDDTYNLIARCIKLAKVNGLPLEGLSMRFDSLHDRFRSKLFKKIFLPILEVYEEILRERDTIDFEDMILRPTHHLRDVERKGFSPGQYKYVLVDEFQDISESRRDFLAEVLAPNSRLFAVGDDWQSIYRFTGSNSMVMKEFVDSENPLVAGNGMSKQDGYSFKPHVYRIQETFRTCKPISDATSEFIQKNPAQIRKSVRSRPPSDSTPAVNICCVDRYNNENLKKILDLIPESDKSKGVFILGRKNREIEAIDPRDLMAYRDDLRISKETIHKSKGLEDDIVIVVGMDSGMRGFPNHGGEDPLVSVFLPPSDSYLNSEERRVMYVAMTRAREKIFLVNQSIQPSPFIEELKEICRRLDIKFNDIVLRGDIIGPCPECLSKGLVEGRWRGVLVRRVRSNSPPYSIFLGCTNFGKGLCNYTSGEVPCPACLTKGKTARLNVRPKEGLEKHEVFCVGCNYSKDYDSFRSNSTER
ncbi:MAG: UvrD-helicase domain-containing protein [Candidatus Dadabacteria bacterium]|nr:UvrD-helicase domain-containing protein [Candidatus Dadabacteria bacterium]